MFTALESSFTNGHSRKILVTYTHLIWQRGKRVGYDVISQCSTKSPSKKYREQIKVLVKCARIKERIFIYCTLVINIVTIEYGVITSTANL